VIHAGLVSTLLLVGFASQVVALKPYVDPEWGFRILRPASWRVHRAEDLGLVIFHARGPFRPPRFVLLPDLPVQGRLRPREAARRVLGDLLGLDRRPGFRWELGGHPWAVGGESRWGTGPSRTRMVFWIRSSPGTGGVTEVTFLSGEAAESEFSGLLGVFRSMRASYSRSR